MTDFAGESIPGGWSQRAVTINGLSFRLTLPADPEQVLDQTAADNREDRDPYWAELWPAALSTAKFVLEHAWTPEAHCLEIGCGIGLLGMAAQAAGLKVTITDKDPRAVRLAVHNAQENGLAKPDSQVLDWHSTIAESYAVVLASDVLYERTEHLPLLDFLRRTLTATGVCWIGDPGRSHASEFVHNANQTGWQVTLFDEHGGQRDSVTIGQFVLLRMVSPLRNEIINGAMN